MALEKEKKGFNTKPPKKPKYGKDSNFKGKKGRSGRKSARDEFLKMRVINKAWLMKEKKMNNNEAIQIVLKDMKDQRDINVRIEELKKIQEDTAKILNE